MRVRVGGSDGDVRFLRRRRRQRRYFYYFAVGLSVVRRRVLLLFRLRGRVVHAGAGRW